MSSYYGPPPNVLGLNGFGYHARISRHFVAGHFPFQPDWRRTDREPVINGYRAEFGNHPYVAIGFSDGGTLCHEIAHSDPNCVGLVVHSGMWRKPPKIREIDILLIVTQGDRTPTYRQTHEAWHYYRSRRGMLRSLDIRQLDSERWMRHEFANSLGVISDWGMAKFGTRLGVICSGQSATKR
jgi:hypothetical protein